MKAKSELERRWHTYVASFACVICRRFGFSGSRAQVHHIAKGSGLRSHFCVAPLCDDHHGQFHSGTTSFLKLYRVPGENEYGLLVYLCEDIARSLAANSRCSDMD